VPLTVRALQIEVAQIKNDLKDTTSDMNDLKNSVSSLNKDVEDETANLKSLEAKHEEDLQKLKLKLLDYEVYNRHENLLFLWDPRRDLRREYSGNSIYIGS